MDEKVEVHVDEFGRSELCRRDGIDAVAAGSYGRGLRVGQTVCLPAQCGPAGIPHMVVEVGDHIHTPGNGVSNYSVVVLRPLLMHTP